MKLKLNLCLSVALMAIFFSAIFSFFQVHSMKKWETSKLEKAGNAFLAPLQGRARTALRTRNTEDLKNAARDLTAGGEVIGVLVFSSKRLLYSSIQLPSSAVEGGWTAAVSAALAENRSISDLQNWSRRLVHFYMVPLKANSRPIGGVVLLQSAAHIQELRRKIALHNLAVFSILLGFVLAATAGLVHLNVTAPVERLAEKLKQLRLGQDPELSSFTRSDTFGPLASEMSYIAKSLAEARTTAEEEARLRLSAESLWTPDKLKEHVRSKLDKPLFLISNREPYMHIRQKKGVECVVPPSGLVTALEPVMRACGGMWIAQGSGDADHEVVDYENKVRVPPSEPFYTLKRVWLTPEEENGHYYGFSNEGLWPLCHITHIRPIFRLEDWNYYRLVNEKFAVALLEEIETEEAPLILIQDYHFALLPQLIRQHRPDARISLFWHIPWPNPESFSICPWKKEIIEGMLGADIIGFHIQFHCNNFLDTVDSVLESKIDWEHFSVERGGQRTMVQPYPISVDSVFETSDGKPPSDSAAIKRELNEKYRLNAAYLAVGVDRLDYTKGIVERLKAVERFLEMHPQYIGKFVFVELGAPSRTHIPRYQDFVVETEKLADGINERFQTKDWKPVIFLKAQHSHDVIVPFYKAADLCLVTSLHDGMNLVAKEFVSARDDEDGVLILSQFTGASRELKDALIVNPYDIESMMENIWIALEMPKPERQDRMRRMRAVVREKNIYRWAANLITDIAQLPEPKPGFFEQEERPRGISVRTA